MAIELSSIDEALSRIKDLALKHSGRFIIGIVGKPGAGKSTLTSHLIENLPKDSVSLVPMDGYHLSNLQLKNLGLSDRKGAFNTFDSNGYVSLLKRINTETDQDIYYPVFHREIEESYAADGVVLANTKIVLTEGNYLLFDKAGWEKVATELTEIWYININDDVRIDRLVKRHEFYGKDKESALNWATGTDEINAKIVESTAVKADVIINI
ncbi:MAG: fructose transporter [Actinobacteria bacterium BACL4 MAG-121022-bin9]|jgi:pantothenate kinase|uniref:nucleoside/nucleotide kinase family protein n=1 Tax=Candidatus Nanopelagicus sp. TaxID=2518620 RepID=UPI000714905A|nr:MAG: fructose transporter [Actinobacteria bacterium BACL4 MAG-121022-bin9]KRO51513.1 MAG: fructose transporter [Actinobacteria bacterium BACL4 MAG-121001-bin59]KRO76887.1 MAG: fructose transporter [Actinobacteria bacterium BACL4 MAG-120920-bin74]KRO93197.1 MAG: fructose transporter [Actinobacteria bacterium BACL4 MAG-120507-bin0]HCP72687.1 nucleoside/nucleotide kinase family protein [Actinomycetota bacterium]